MLHKFKIMYNKNRLSGIRRVTLITETPQNFVWSCQTASELLISVIRLLLLSPRAKTTENFAGFFLLADRQGALANGLHGLNPRNTDNRTHPLHCRSALVERLIKDWVQRWNKAQSISELTRQAHLVALVLFRRIKMNYAKQSDGERWYIHPWRTYA